MLGAAAVIRSHHGNGCPYVRSPLNACKTDATTEVI